MTETVGRILNIETPEAMHSHGISVGRELFPGAFIALFGGLGAGKTTLTKGIADALDITGILSPTFTIVRHHEGKLPLDHFDAYRIEDPDELYAIGYEDHLASGAVIVMEWCENVPEALPEERLEIHIEGSGEEPRIVALRALGERYSELLKELKL